jgi:hypothetical protein
MLNAGCQDEHIPSAQSVLVFQCIKENVALEDVYGDRPVCAVRWQISTRRNGDDSEPQWTFFYECARCTPVPGEKYRVNHPLVPG